MRDDDDKQLARLIYLRHMSAMKEILKLGEFKIGARNTEEYKYFKKVVMDQFYTAMGEVFSSLERRGLLKRCSCGTSIRQGYKPCPKCNGAGHCNSIFTDGLDLPDPLDDQPEPDDITDEPI